MSERWNLARVTSAPSISISTVTARRSTPGRSEQTSFDSASGSIGSPPPGAATLGPPPGGLSFGRSAVGLSLERLAGTNVGGHVGDVNPDAEAVVAESLGRDRVVEVARGDGVDREGRQVRQVGARDVANGGVGRLARGALDPRRERAPQAAVEHERLDDVARDVRAAEHPRDLRTAAAPAAGRLEQRQAAGAGVARALDRDAPAALEERLADEEAPGPLEPQDARGGRAPPRPVP